jgi:hypothetical protein
MNELYELKEKLCRELKKYSSEDVTTNSLEVIDKLSHAIKNIDKIIEKYEEEEGASYGYGSYEGSYRGGRNNRGSYNNGNSYARGRGRNAKRDSMGRYSSNGSSYNDGYSRNADIASELRELMMDAPDEQTRMEYQRVINKLEQM